MTKMFKGITGVALRENRPLTRTELESVVPSIFAVDGHESRSDRFAPVATIDVLDSLQNEGYFPFFAVQTKSKDKRFHTKHMVRLRQNDGKKEGEAREIILVNANDGTSAYQLMAGEFRFVCSNGLIMGNMTHNTKVYHKGNNVMNDVIEGVYHVVKDFDEIDRYKHEMSLINMDTAARQGFALAGYMLKEGIPESFENLKYRPTDLLSHRGLNTDDRYDNTLYSTFNTVQQHLMNGGQSGWTTNEETGVTRRTSSRGISQIDKQINVNSRLWDMAINLVNSSRKSRFDAEEIADAVLS